MGNNETDENEHLTVTELIPLKKSGNSYGLRFPSEWRKTLKEFQLGPIMFAVHIERSNNGRVLLIGEKAEIPISKAKVGGE